MKNLLKHPLLLEFTRITDNMYRLGYDERNGGNISYLLKEEEIKGYLNPLKVLRELDLGFETKTLIGKYFLVTGTTKYFRNTSFDPETNLGLFRIKEDGKTAQLLWGYKDGGTFTSEISAHLMVHETRLAINPKNRIVMHCHPLNIIILTHVEEWNEKEVTLKLWRTMTESAVVFPEGVGIMPWMVTGNNEAGRLTSEKIKEYRLVMWALHGIYGVGNDFDEAFGLIETVEKAAELYLRTKALGEVNTIDNEGIRAIGKRYNLTLKEEFLK
ncbi:MAG: rhamnulose-1-phosphate aldolase [Bacillales bacterium]|jgi:rhamnulose-1-phosphate aldolase|nr:rhamnulose-1-phosphate aldolase [Bacillales bacterium]